MEVLSDILRSMRVTGSVYFCERLESPWEMEIAEEEKASFHLVRRGSGWLISDDLEVRLGPGDFIFAEPGRRHSLRSDAAGEFSSSASTSTLLLCGYCEFHAPSGHPLLQTLPSLCVVRDEELLEHVWLKNTLDQLSREFLSDQPGSDVVIDKLTEILVVELIRINFGRERSTGFISALFDPQIKLALELLHAQPEFPWTLEILADQVSVSRAALARRFKERVGQTMFQYLTDLRMQRARALLEETTLPMIDIASQAGYESDLAFAKAFKRNTGITPAKYRARNR